MAVRQREARLKGLLVIYRIGRSVFLSTTTCPDLATLPPLCVHVRVGVCVFV